MVAIIDYGVGNLFSLKSSLAILGVDTVVTSDKEIIESADKIILPGVGAFGDAAIRLANTGLDKVIIAEAKKGKHLLGICLGMQLLFDKSYEYGEHNGLGLIPGTVCPIDPTEDNLKIPHIGWNSLKFKGNKSPIFKYLKDGDFVYFVHSFYASECEKNTIATTYYGNELCAAAANENVFGCQFHPEKSGEIGLKILKAFANLKEEDIC